MLQTAEKGTPRPPPPPPPPPKKKMVTKPTNDANSNNEDQKKVEKYMKYKNMMNLKIPDGEIKEAMENDGLTQNDINRFFEQLFCQFADFSALTTMNFNEMKLESKEPQEVINIGSHAGERAAKYSQMRIMGVSDAAVRSEMIEDKMSQEFIDGFFHNISTISPIKSVSKKSAETQTNSNALSSKSGKVPRPRPASSGFSVSPGIGFAHTSNGNNNQDEFVEVNPMRALSQRGGLSADQNTASRASAPVFARVPSGSVRMAPLYNTAPHSMTVSASSKGVPNVVSEMESVKAQELAKQSDSLRNLILSQPNSSKSLRNVSTVSSKSFKAQMSSKKLGLGSDSSTMHNQLDFSDMIDEFPAATRKPLAKSISSRLLNMFTGQ